MVTHNRSNEIGRCRQCEFKGPVIRYWTLLALTFSCHFHVLFAEVGFDTVLIDHRFRERYML